MLDELGARGELEWTSAIVDGPGGLGRHRRCEGYIPLAVAVSGANMHDSLALKPLIPAYPLSGPAGEHGGADPSNSAPTRRTSPPNTWRRCASAGSSRASRGPHFLAFLGPAAALPPGT